MISNAWVLLICKRANKVSLEAFAACTIFFVFNILPCYVPVTHSLFGNFERRFSNLEALLYMTMTAAYSKSARARSQNQGRNFGITAGGGVWACFALLIGSVRRTLSGPLPPRQLFREKYFPDEYTFNSLPQNTSLSVIFSSIYQNFPTTITFR
jgi:hypothetical protein